MVALVVTLGTACGGNVADASREVEIGQLLATPASFADTNVRFRAIYFEDPQVRVLTEALAESYPPQPAGSRIWVDGRSPEGDCVTSDIGTTWGDVEVEGIFRYAEEGGLGVPPIFEMAVADARLSCPLG